MKIGKLVQSNIDAIFRSCDTAELQRLMDKQFSKKTFNLNFPFCAEEKGIPHERYWTDTHFVHGKVLRVCSQWYEASKVNFWRYLESKGIASNGDWLSHNNSPSRESANPASRAVRIKTSWPEWRLPNEAELLQLAKLTTPYIRFLHPDIVRHLVEDNESHRERWLGHFKQCGINPDLYLWRNSSCAFPGVRRYAGSSEIAQYRGRMEKNARPLEALKLDDNDFPKHIWSYVFQGKPFQKKGPTGYSLAHLVDHKSYKNRQLEELERKDGCAPVPAYFGLYTSVTNTVYLPEGLIRPTDFAFLLRNLIQRKADAIYGSICNLIPPGHAFLHGTGTEAWRLDNFDWEDPVGTTEHLGEFLNYRNNTMEAMFDAQHRQQLVGAA